MERKPSDLAPSENLHVLYEDNHLIAVYKPSGVLVQADASGAVSLMDMTREYIKNKRVQLAVERIAGGFFITRQF